MRRELSAGVADFLRARSTRSAVREALQSMLASGAALGSCRWQRVKARPGRKLSVWLDATVVHGSQKSVRPVAVEWTADPVDHVDEPGDIAGAAPFVRLTHQDAFSLKVSPHDPEFPNLARLLDRTRQGLPVDTIRYRPGERHVLRFDGSTEFAGTTYAKLARPGDGQRVVDSATRFADAVNAGGRLVVGPIGVLDDAVVYPATGGQALSRLDPYMPVTVEGWMRRVGAAVARIHEAAPTSAGVEHTVEHELAIAVRAVRHIGDLAPEHRDTIEDIVGRLREVSSRTEPVDIVALHGDLKLDHLHRRAGQLLVIDIDRAGRGEAAVDLGNLLADVRWWSRASPPENTEAAVAGVIAGYGDATADSPRTRLMEAIGLLRIAGRRPQLTSRSWLADTTQLLHAVERLVTRLE